MEILLGLSEADIEIIRKLVFIARRNCEEYQKREDKGVLTNEEEADYGDWLVRNDLFTRMEALIDNQILLGKKNSTPDAREESSNLLSSTALPGGNAAIESHLKRMKKQTEHDKKMIQIMRKGLDMPFNLMGAYVSHSGILLKKRRYSSDELSHLVGRHVLVTKPKDGCIQVYSIKGEYLAKAFIKKK